MKVIIKSIIDHPKGGEKLLREEVVDGVDKIPCFTAMPDGFNDYFLRVMTDIELSPYAHFEKITGQQDLQLNIYYFNGMPAQKAVESDFMKLARFVKARQYSH